MNDFVFVFWIILFVVGVGWIVKLALRKFLKHVEIENTYWCDDKAHVFKVWIAFLDIEEEIKEENPTVRFPGIETAWIAEKAGFSQGKTLGALNELAKDGKVHCLWGGDCNRWYAGNGTVRGM